MKTIYLVRHGESEGNAGPITNTPDTPLTENGRNQAKLLAERFSKIEIDTMISSPFVRAKETGDAILEKTGIPREFSDLLVELRRPSISIGAPHGHTDVLAAEQTIIDNFAVPGFRHSDEENFEDIKKRVAAAFDLLAKQPKDNILVVSHGLFLRVMAAYLIHGDKLTAEECRQFMRTMGTENTCISVFEYEAGHEWKPWRLLRWNDHAHLG